MSYFDQRKAEISNLPLSLITNPNSLQVAVNSSSTNSFDRIVVASIGITYPSKFNFGGARQFEFELAASPIGNYLEINNFNYGTQPPILFDKTEGVRYLGDVASTPGVVKFVLPPSVAAKTFLLVNQSATCAINSCSNVSFIDFGDTENQGNYLIVTHPNLSLDANGNNL
jgi:hypothetical protein